jgi:hypothetical protein
VPRAVKPWTWRKALRDYGPRQQGLLLTLYTLGTYLDRDGFAYPAQKTLARGARTSVRTIRRHMRQAVGLGWMSMEQMNQGGQDWRCYRYRCAVPDHIPLSRLDETMADGIVSNYAEIEGADKAMSSPSTERADSIVSPPASAPNPTCGHPRPQRADIQSTTCGQAGGQNVRTQLVPTNSRLETHVRTHVGEGALARTVCANGISKEDQEAKIRELFAEVPDIAPGDAAKQLHVPLEMVLRVGGSK